MASPKKAKMEAAPAATAAAADHDSPSRMEGMNPERVQRLRRNPTPKGDEPSDQEVAKCGPKKTGANCQALGTGPSRSSSAKAEEMESRLTKVDDPSTMLVVKLPRITGASASVLTRPKRSHSQLEDTEEIPQNGRGKNPLTTKDAFPQQEINHDAHRQYLASLLDCHHFRLTIWSSPTKNGTPAPVTYNRIITTAGLLLHNMISSRTNIPVLPLPSLADHGKSLDQMVKGQILDIVWNQLTPTAKYSIARQLRKIVTLMRQVSPDNKSQLLGAATSGPYSIMMDKHEQKTHYQICLQPTHHDFVLLLQKTFNSNIPRVVATTLADQFRSSYPLVLTHGELGPRHIIVDNNKIVAITGWGCAGWYPEWWEYVRFFETSVRRENMDWYNYVEEIFEDAYPTELTAYQGISRCQDH